MAHAYQEMYLSNAQALLGDAFDYAVNACGISGNDFVKLFSVSSVSKRIENGEPAYLAGKSGIEVVEDILVETTGKAPTAKPQVTFSRSREYWIGWAIAYYQWFSGRKFGDIFKVLSFEDLQQMYAPLHEADISKFANIADAKVRAYFTDTNLKRIRTTYGCTQAELAKRSGVSLRSIQMYEQHNKDINKASAETVLSLAKVLGCTMEDLLETPTKTNLKNALVADIDADGIIYKSIMEYVQLLNEKSADITLPLASVCSCKVTARVKAQNSIEFKIQNYKTERHEFGKIPINKCINDLFGIRIFLREPLTFDEVYSFIEDTYPNRYRCIDSSKFDYKAVHLYFKENNQSFPWELQIWNMCDMDSNFSSHKKYKQEYTAWEKESKEGGIIND